MLLALTAPFAYSPTAADAKQRLRGTFSGGGASLEPLACPTTKAALQLEQRILGGMPLWDSRLAATVRESATHRVRRHVGTGVRRSCLTSTSTGAKYPVADVYFDLLPSASATIGVEDLANELRDAWNSRMQTQFFRTPAMAFLYERGWRQQFNTAGFPGIDKEFEEVAEFFAPAADGGTVVDLSCGSGLMTRRLCRAGRYGSVLALDYSEAMLRETSKRFDEEAVPREALTLCRADAAALPLQSGAVDALHAGAAMHCWPQLEASLAEVHRVLKPGGRFFATTFYKGAMGGSAGGGASQPQPGMMRMFADEGELESLLAQAGFTPELTAVRREGRGCAIIRAEKACD
jgi:SAM-dependent methyltransferase